MVNEPLASALTIGDIGADHPDLESDICSRWRWRAVVTVKERYDRRDVRIRQGR